MRLISVKRGLLLLAMCLSFVQGLQAQQSRGDWFRFPGFGPESPLTLTNEQVFYGVMGATVLSYTLSEWVLKDEENLNFYQVRSGMNSEYFWGLKKVWHQNFGIEKRVSSWFAFALELNLQQWSERSPGIESQDKFGLGAGIMTYYRWYLFGTKRLSPYLEYGTGLFQGFEQFPYNGTKFTFNHSTQLGLEYTFKNKNKLRLGYGQFHQSNNGLVQPNPGYDGDGFSVVYSWFWHTKR